MNLVVLANFGKHSFGNEIIDSSLYSRLVIALDKRGLAVRGVLLFLFPLTVFRIETVSCWDISFKAKVEMSCPAGIDSQGNKVVWVLNIWMGNDFFWTVKKYFED